MRFTALLSRKRQRLQVSIEAASQSEAEKAAELWARYKHSQVDSVARDYAVLRVVGGEVQVILSILAGGYETLEPLDERSP